MNRIKRVIVAMGLLACGCGSQSSYEEPEHSRPAHWPATFAALVEDLERRTAATPAPGTPEASQLDDLLEWLPEIAGDTSLSEEQWADAVAMRDRIGAEGEGRESAIRRLRELAVVTEDDPPPFVPGRDNSNHHDHASGAQANFKQNGASND